MSEIETAESKFHAVYDRLRVDDGIDLTGREAELHIVHGWHRTDVRPFSPTAVSVSPPLPVIVNAGRWLVRCPCGGAQYASRKDQRFFCIDCLNGGPPGAWIKTVWPAEADAIERVLARRPDKETRSWHPGETVGDLERENAARGIA